MQMNVSGCTNSGNAISAEVYFADAERQGAVETFALYLTVHTRILNRG
jgi:hypothetical protein